MKLNRCEHFREDICLLASGTGGLKPPNQQAGSLRYVAQPSLPAGSGLFQSPVEKHLATCADCKKFYNEIQSLVVPLTNWESSFVRIEPNQNSQTLLASAIKSADQPKAIHRLSTAIQTLWRELIWPCRQAWTGMATLWLVLLGINSGLNSGEGKQMAGNSAPVPAMLQRMEEQRQLLAELIPPAISQPAEPPRRNQPQPRSDRQTVWIIG